jgi:hypothetical protein
MLSLIKFKKSLFAGALDGGEKEVFLGGSRLTKFMETVEKATGSIPEAAIEDRAQTDGDAASESESDAQPEAAAPQLKPDRAASAPSDDPLAGLLQTGLVLLEQLAQAVTRPQADPGGATPGLTLVQRDQRTGQSYLKIPVPSPEVLDRALSAIGALLERYRK